MQCHILSTFSTFGFNVLDGSICRDHSFPFKESPTAARNC